jgi:site-specific recombinase XerD
MASITFRSSLAQEISNLLTFKQMEGFDYTTQARYLGYFDTFLCEQGYCQTTLNRQIVDAYIKHTANHSLNGLYIRLCPVRVLSRYLHQLDPESYVLRELPFKKPVLPRWYLYPPEEITSLLRCAETLGPAGSLRPHCFYTLVGLLYVTGLRISEALALNIGDLDTRRRMLFVRKGKFGKERYVALHPTAIAAIEKYLVRRNDFGSPAESSPLFLNLSGARLKYQSAAKTFQRMIRQCEIGHDGQQKPRLHDLRHSFACNCVLKWYEEGADVNSKLPILATAMGHVNINNTQIYLHVSSRLLKQGAQRFYGTFTASCQGE